MIQLLVLEEYWL